MGQAAGPRAAWNLLSGLRGPAATVMERVDRYGIKPGYRINEKPAVYSDCLEDSARFQVEVYVYAGELARSPHVRSVLDIGCGLATKLITHLAPRCDRLTGVDLPATTAQCERLHPVGRWIAADIEDPAFSMDGSYDLIISADVIEHLRDPDRLLEHIRRASHHGTQVVLSTPERDRRRGKEHMGPPANGAHVREWNRDEFCAYVESRGFSVRESRIVEHREGMRTCHLVLARLR